MKRILALGALALPGCLFMFPKVAEKHPSGYSKLVKVAPVCEDPNSNQYGSCMQSAEMFEASSPQRATALFISHWEMMAFGSSQRGIENAEKDKNAVGLVGDSIMLGKNIRAVEGIAVPTIRKIYETSDTPYAKAMLNQVDLILVHSRSSFDTFRISHTAAVQNPGAAVVATTAAPATPIPVATPAAVAASTAAPVAEARDLVPPKEQGPLFIKTVTLGRQEVAAGRKVKVGLVSGSSVIGTIKAVSEDGILLNLGDAGEITVWATDITQIYKAN